MTSDAPPALRAAPLWARCLQRAVRHLPRGRYRAVSALNERLRCAPFVAAIHAGAKADQPRFICDISDRIACEVFLTGFYDPQETVLIRHILRPGMIFADVGANWGYFTLLGARHVGPTGRVIAFEPHPGLFSLLKANVLLNNYSWVTPLDRAVANQNATMHLGAYDERDHNRGTSQLLTGSRAGHGAIPVQSIRLEEALSPMGIFSVDLLKIDVEGAEALILPNLALADQPLQFRRILIEFHPAQLTGYQTTAAQLLEPFYAANYTAWQLDHSPAVHRAMSYRLPMNPKPFLRQFQRGSPLDEWPHLLLTAPGFDPIDRPACR